MPKETRQRSEKAGKKRAVTEGSPRRASPRAAPPRSRRNEGQEELYETEGRPDGEMPTEDDDRVAPEDIYQDEAGEEGGMDGEGVVGRRARKPALTEAEAESVRRIQALLEKHQDDEPRGRKGKRTEEKKFELVEHTADVGIQAYGDTVSQAFENAALGMFSIITDPSRVSPTQDFRVTVEGEDLKEVLQDWLSQLLILSQVNGMLFSGFRVELRPVDGRVVLTGQAIGEPVDPDRHVYKTEIKAVTHHMLEVHENPPKVKVLFDL
jgi:SHS2 domain-containing protein